MWLCWRPAWCMQSTTSHKCHQALLLLKLPRLPESSLLPEHILSLPIHSSIRSLVIGCDDPGMVLGVGDTERKGRAHALRGASRRRQSGRYMCALTFQSQAGDGPAYSEHPGQGGHGSLVTHGHTSRTVTASKARTLYVSLSSSTC